METWLPPVLLLYISLEQYTSAADKHSLGVNYGIDEKNLDSPLDGLQFFDLTRSTEIGFLMWNLWCFHRDLPADILHHLALGWCKKAIGALKDDILSTDGLSEVCAIFDRCVIWKVLHWLIVMYNMQFFF